MVLHFQFANDDLGDQLHRGGGHACNGRRVDCAFKLVLKLAESGSALVEFVVEPD